MVYGRLDACAAVPFSKKNRLYPHIPGVDTRYRLRGGTLMMLARCVADMVEVRSGNYLVFFPSHIFTAAYPFIEHFMKDRARVYMQMPAMTETQKKLFLGRIGKGEEDSQPVQCRPGGAGRIVRRGGRFARRRPYRDAHSRSGLPAVFEKQELIRMYFDERSGEGFLYAYIIPGLIWVIQSAGRVFRTPEDRRAPGGRQAGGGGSSAPAAPGLV